MSYIGMNYVGWKYYQFAGMNVGIQSPDGRQSTLLVDPDVQAWLAAGNIPLTADPVIVPIPSLNAAQIRLQLTISGLRTQVEAAVASSTDQTLKDLWSYSPSFNRSNVHIIAMATALNVTSAQLDQLFIDGSKL